MSGMTQPPREVLDYLATLTDDEYAAVSRTARDPDRTRQLTRADLQGMTPEAIDAARVAGTLDTLLGRPTQSTAAQLSREDLAHMSPDAIVAAKAAGRLDTLLGITTT
jgi:hypothetical protein